MTTQQDLDTPQAIKEFVQRFYDKLLADEQLGPIFLQTAAIDLQTHREVIESFWRKLLLGEVGYDRHMMNIHREIHDQRQFTAADFERWLAYFEATLDEHYHGELTHRARYLARSIATNLKEALLNPGQFSQRTRYIENRAAPIRKRID